MVCSAMAIIAGTGPPPSRKISTSAMTISGMARSRSKTRRKGPTSHGTGANPRVTISDKNSPTIAPSRVEAAAIFTVSISDGRYFAI